MPTLALFDGIRITMYWGDHPPPHFHAEADGEMARIAIWTGRILRGQLRASAGRKVEAWRKRNLAGLMTAWDCCQIGITPPTMS